MFKSHLNNRDALLGIFQQYKYCKFTEDKPREAKSREVNATRIKILHFAVRRGDLSGHVATAKTITNRPSLQPHQNQQPIKFDHEFWRTPTQFELIFFSIS